MTVENEWYLVSSHGAVLFYVAVNRDCTIRNIADAMSRTRRTIWSIVGDLRRAGLLHVRKDGRTHHYTVDLDGPLKHPTLFQGQTIRSIFGGLVEQYSQSPLSQQS